MEDIHYPLNKPISQAPFEEKRKVLAVRVEAKDVSTTMATLKTVLYQHKGKKSVYNDATDEKFRVIALDVMLTRAEIQAKLQELTPGKQWIYSEAEIEFNYKDYNYHEVLKKLLPADITTPSGFETIGHIAHLNLKEPQYPWKYLIGQVILEKTKGIKTVVNKMDKLSNEFRTPELELIAGEKIYDTVVLEEKASIHVDFEKTYWCSRLQAERSRIIQTLTNADVICDAFCGVGPFAVRAAKEKGCRVYASDLNPECFTYLKTNIAANKVTHLVEPQNADARKYIQTILARVYSKEIIAVTRWFMNLPGDAVEFLDAFALYYKDHPEHLQEGVFAGGKVHVYCFLIKGEDQEMKQALLERVQKVLPNFEEEDIEEIHTLKSVSTDKDMCCLTFKLTTANCNPVDPSKGSKKLKTA